MEIFLLYIIINVVVAFFSLKWGISLYLVYTFLVPVDLPFMSTTVNTVVHASFLLSLLFHRKKFRTQYSILEILRPYIPIVLIYFVFFFFSIFQENVPFNGELRYWQNDMRQYFILPILMWYISLSDDSCKTFFNKAIVISGIVIFLYGIALLFMKHFNPYVLYMAKISGQTVSDRLLGLTDQLRLMDRTSSLFMHPMNYGLYLNLILVYFICIKDKINNWLLWILVCLALICVFASGIRTPMVTLVVSVTIYALCLRKFKVFFCIIVFTILGVEIISKIPELAGTVESIFDSGKDVQGSSFNVRLSQFYGCLDEIESCPWFGKGYGWTTYYLSQNETHSVILAFESLVFVLLCNWGVLGCILFVYGYFRFTKNSIKLMPDMESKSVIVTFVATFLTYCILTGDYHYTIMFMIIYTMIIVNNCDLNNLKKLSCPQEY